MENVEILKTDDFVAKKLKIFVFFNIFEHYSKA